MDTDGADVSDNEVQDETAASLQAAIQDRDEAMVRCDEILTKYNHLLREHQVATTRIVKLSDRVNRVDQIDAALTDLVLELQVRHTSGHGKIHAASVFHKDDYGERRREVVKNCKGDSLALTTLLAMSFRTHFMYLEDCNAELVQKLSEREREVEVKDSCIKQSDVEKDLLVVNLRREKEEVYEMLLEMQRNQAEAVSHYEKEIEGINQEKLNQQQQLNAYEQSLQARDEVIAHHEEDLVPITKELERIPELEELLRAAKESAANDFKRLSVVAREKIHQAEKDHGLYMQAKAQCEKLSLQVSDLKKELSTTNNNIRHRNWKDAEAKSKRAEDAAMRIRSKLSDVNAEYDKMKLLQDYKDQEIARLQVEREQLLKQVTKLKAENEARTTVEKIPKSEVKEIASKNKHYAYYYKVKLKKKLEENENLKAKLIASAAATTGSSSKTAALYSDNSHSMREDLWSDVDDQILGPLPATTAGGHDGAEVTSVDGDESDDEFERKFNILLQERERSKGQGRGREAASNVNVPRLDLNRENKGPTGGGKGMAVGGEERVKGQAKGVRQPFMVSHLSNTAPVTVGDGGGGPPAAVASHGINTASTSTSILVQEAARERAMRPSSASLSRNASKQSMRVPYDGVTISSTVEVGKLLSASKRPRSAYQRTR